MTGSVTTLRGALALALFVGAGAPRAAADPAQDLQSREWRVRLAAVAAIQRDGGPTASGLLAKALDDDDWEVVELAAVALAERGTPDATKALLSLAVDGPVLRVRIAAGLALGKIDAEGAAKALTRLLTGDSATRAAEAMAVVARSVGDGAGDLLRKAIEKAAKAKEPDTRAAVAGTLSAFLPPDRPFRLARALEDVDLRAGAAATDEARRVPDPAYVVPLLTVLRRPLLNDVIARRVSAAIVAAFRRVTDAKEREQRINELRAVLAETSEPEVTAQLSVLVGLLAQPTPAPAERKPDATGDSKPTPAQPAPGTSSPPSTAPVPSPPAAPVPPASAQPRPPVLTADEALKTLEPALVHKGEAARAAAAKTLGVIASDKALERAATLAVTDPGARVRLQAMRAVVLVRGIHHDAARRLAIDRLAYDVDAVVREDAAVLLGASGPENTAYDAPVQALEAALADPQWTVAASAAVSLGKTRSALAVAPLRRMADPKTVKDWKRRGAAVAGLGLLLWRDAVPALVAALGDKDPYVKRSAFEFLRRLTPRDVPPERDAWNDWWTKLKPTFEFVDHEKAAREAKKAGYAIKPAEVYEKLDVVVLQSRGDHIEQLLKTLKIEHRMTRAASVTDAELHPFAIFVSNCTGEIHKDDVERLQWFVRTGGYLFGSCWALHHTVELVQPGLVRKLVTKAQVIDHVEAEACPVDSPFFEGVFPSFTRPVYRLEGAHLIEVLQPERVEVLIDSPSSAARWGGGNLAAWFAMGHGVVLDSVNHFDSQGLAEVVGLRTAKTRMAYAIDHMGVDYEEARDFAAQRVFDSHSEAVKQVRDLSAFRFLTNFVRHKRRGIF